MVRIVWHGHKSLVIPRFNLPQVLGSEPVPALRDGTRRNDTRVSRRDWNGFGQSLGPLLPRSYKRRPNAIPIRYRLSQHPTELRDVDVALAAGEHQGTVVFEVVTPGDDLVIRPARRILAHLLIRHAVHVGPQVVAGFIRTLVDKRLLFEIPSRLLHRISNGLLHNAEYGISLQTKM